MRRHKLPDIDNNNAIVIRVQVLNSERFREIDIFGWLAE